MSNELEALKAENADPEFVRYHTDAEKVETMKAEIKELHMRMDYNFESYKTSNCFMKQEMEKAKAENAKLKDRIEEMEADACDADQLLAECMKYEKAYDAALKAVESMRDAYASFYDNTDNDTNEDGDDVHVIDDEYIREGENHYEDAQRYAVDSGDIGLRKATGVYEEAQRELSIIRRMTEPQKIQQWHWLKSWKPVVLDELQLQLKEENHAVSDS